jgi:Ca2+-binding RTX toxin-like protein
MSLPTLSPSFSTDSSVISGGAGADAITIAAALSNSTIFGGEGNDTLSVAGDFLSQLSILYGGGGADRFQFDTGNAVGTNTVSATMVVIADFQRGTDKIQLLSGLTVTGASPSIINAATFGSTYAIAYTSVGSDLIVYITGNGNNYLAVKLTGISIVDGNDFEFL